MGSVRTCHPVKTFSFLKECHMVSFPVSGVDGDKVSMVRICIHEGPHSLMRRVKAKHRCGVGSGHNGLTALFRRDGVSGNVCGASVTTCVRGLSYFSRVGSRCIMVTPDCVICATSCDTFLGARVSSNTSVALVCRSISGTGSRFPGYRALGVGGRGNILSVRPGLKGTGGEGVFVSACMVGGSLFLSLVRGTRGLSSVCALTSVMGRSYRRLSIHTCSRHKCFTAVSSFGDCCRTGLSLVSLGGTASLFRSG